MRTRLVVWKTRIPKERYLRLADIVLSASAWKTKQAGQTNRIREHRGEHPESPEEPPVPDRMGTTTQARSSCFGPNTKGKCSGTLKGEENGPDWLAIMILSDDPAMNTLEIFLPHVCLTLGPTAVYSREPPTGADQRQKSPKRSPRPWPKEWASDHSPAGGTPPQLGVCNLWDHPQPTLMSAGVAALPAPPQEPTPGTAGRAPSQAGGMSAKRQYPPLPRGCLLIRKV